MRAIIDESVPRKLLAALREAGCLVEPFPREWKGTRNGELIAGLIKEGYDLFLTSDKSMPFQNPTALRGLAVVVLPANRLSDLLPLVPKIATVVSSIRRGEIVRVGMRDDRLLPNPSSS